MFQIDIQGSRAEFQRERECDGVLLWDFIRRRVNPSTSVGASRLKEKLENTTLKDLDHDVIRYNTWFEDMRDGINKEEGEGYSEYLRVMFRAYMSSSNQPFLDAIQVEERDWMQGEVRQGYNYRDLMNLGRLTYNNLVEKGSWEVSTSPAKEDPAVKYLALATEMLRSYNKDGKGTTDDGGKRKNWRYDNPDNLKEKKIGGRTMKWCKQDCHRRPQWCGRRNCLSNAEYEAQGSKRRDAKPGKPTDSSGVGTKMNVTKDFRLALAALTTEGDFEALEKQFFSVKE